MVRHLEAETLVDRQVRGKPTNGFSWFDCRPNVSRNKTYMSRLYGAKRAVSAVVALSAL